MAPRSKWTDLRAETTQETRERAARRTVELLAELPLEVARQPCRASEHETGESTSAGSDDLRPAEGNTQPAAPSTP